MYKLNFNFKWDKTLKVKNNVYYLNGDYRGTLIDNDITFNFSDSLRVLSYDIKKFVLSSYGDFVVLEKTKNTTIVYVSVSHPGFYYTINGNIINFSLNEIEIVKSLNDLALKNIIFNHQLVGRSFYGEELGKDVNRVSGGMLYDINNNIAATFLIIPIFKKESYRSSKLENQIKLSLKALVINREIGLLYSGGIDSSVLFVLLNELCNFYPTHFLYEGINSDDHRLIQRFNKFFNDRITIEAKQKSSIKDIINEMSQGFNKIVGAQYLNKRKTKGDYAISGQNLDTLYHVDTFSPGSNYYGFIGFLMNFKFSYSRFLQSSYALSLSKLSVIRFLFNDFKEIHENYDRILNTLYSEPSEHVSLKSIIRNGVYIKNNYITDLIDNSFKYFKLKENKNIYLKISRFYRTAHNVSANYNNSNSNNHINRILPYVQGPMVSYFIHNTYPLKDIILIKGRMYSIFKRKTKVSYSKFVEVNGRNKLIPYLKQKFLSSRSASNKTIPVDLINLLRNEICTSDSVVLNSLKINFSEEYLKIKSLLNESDISKMKKEELNVLLKFINLEIYLKNYNGNNSN